MRRSFQPLVIVLSVLSLVAALVSAGGSAAGAYTGPTSGKTYSAGTIVSMETGAKYGPNSYTRAEVGKITGFTKVVYCKSPTQYVPKVSVSSSPLVTQHVQTAEQSPKCIAGVVGADGLVHPMSWWNPFSWNWGSIMGKIWDNIFVACAKGATTGFVGGIAANKIAPFLLRGAAVETGPYGYAVLAISGCFVNIFS